MSETILNIEKVEFIKTKNHYYNHVGWLIKTDKQDIYAGIADDDTFSDFGHNIVSDVDLNYYEGSQLLSVKISNNLMNKDKWLKYFGGDLTGFNFMLINIETSKGTFQVVLWNEGCECGCRCRNALIKSMQLKKDVKL